MKRIVAILVLMVAFTPVTFAQAGSVSEPEDPAVAVAHFLEFSDSQTAEFRLALIEMQDAVERLQIELQSKHMELHEVLSLQAPAAIDVGRIVVDITSIERDVGIEIEEYHNTFMQLLTPDQMLRVMHVVRARELLPAVAIFAAVRLVEPPTPLKH